jgi:predicted nucleotidyltransferase
VVFQLDLCKWPDLQEPYAKALQEAVTYILEHYEVLGIVLAGTIMYGSAMKSSDLDIFVVQAQSFRQRVQKFFNGIPAEIFVNPPKKIEDYFESEAERGRPCTAHMLANGFVILKSDPVVDALIQRAKQVLERLPNPPAEKLVYLSYMAAIRFEDALDILQENPEGALLIMNLAVYEMLQYAFWVNNKYLPRDKDLLEALAEIDHELEEMARLYYKLQDYDKRFEIAEKIAERTIQEKGFFEWESPVLDV